MGLVYPFGPLMFSSVWAVGGPPSTIWAIDGAGSIYLGRQLGWIHLFGLLVGFLTFYWVVGGPFISMGCWWAFYWYGPLVGLAPPFGPGFIRLGL